MSPEEAINSAIMLILNVNTSDQDHVTKSLSEILDLLRPALAELIEE